MILDSSVAAAGDAAVSGFLSLPMPRSEAENQIYFDLIRPGRQAGTAAFLDITEILPVTNPRSWPMIHGYIETDHQSHGSTGGAQLSQIIQHLSISYAA